MKVLVTGSAGHLGEALVRTLRKSGCDVIGIDTRKSWSTSYVGSIVDREFVKRCLSDVQVVMHTAALHKPHVATHRRQDFIDTNVTGILNLLEEAVAAGVSAFVFTSTTSVFGDALVPPIGHPTRWLTEDVATVPKNIYGVTKKAGEELCQLFYRNKGLCCIALRVARFFLEQDDDKSKRLTYENDNIKMNEYVYRRVDIEDAVSAHLLAAKLAPVFGFRQYIISATTPFEEGDMSLLRTDARRVLRHRVPTYEAEYEKRNWTMYAGLDRVYINKRAREELGWRPKHSFETMLDRLRCTGDIWSPLARTVGIKGYHSQTFSGMPYPVETDEARHISAFG